MPRTNTSNQKKPKKDLVSPPNPFELSKQNKPSRQAAKLVHSIGPGLICDTESRGHENPDGRSDLEIVVDASEGFIPLWAKDSVLRWRFRERSFSRFVNPTAAKDEVRKLLGEALLQWGDVAPVKFTEEDDVWDFEIVMRPGDDCDATGCVLASAFFPDPGRNELTLYPKLFTMPREEQVETLVHEIGHIFGLRHFFAKITETKWPAEIFGTHSKFTIMNYGELSKVTDDDRNDLRKLYQLAWSGNLNHINNTPIRFIKPYNTLAALTGPFAMASAAAAVMQPHYISTHGNGV